MYKKLSNPAYGLYFLIKSDMRVLWKWIMILTICTVVSVVSSVRADTGDVVWSGSTSTGNLTTGSVVTTGTTAGGVFTWSLLTYLNTQESSMSALLTTAYGQLYTTFIKTWLNILKSIDYQSLVCLWALKDVSLLAQMQKDKTALTIAFKQDFIDLENQVLALEEKQALQESDNVNMFDVGTTYESEKAKLKDLIDTKVKLHKWFITTYATTYAGKNTEFLTTYLQYRTANTEFLNTIQNKITKVQSIITAFSWIEAAIATINTKVTWLDDVMKKIEESKTKGLANMQSTLQSLIDTNIKKYKKLQNLADALTQQQAYVVSQYQTDLNGYLNTSMQNRYNRSQYLTLKDEVNAFKAKFFTATNQLNCANILSASPESTWISVKITTMSIAVNSWLVKIATDGISTTFKDQLYSGFQALYLQKFKQRYGEFIEYIKAYIKTAINTVISPSISTGTNVTTWFNQKITYVFTRPFKSGEYAEGIKVLQNLLTTLQLYSGTINGIYDKATKDAVYKFQLSKWLLKGYEKKPDVRWWMGPATRAALNQLTK